MKQKIAYATESLSFIGKITDHRAGVSGYSSEVERAEGGRAAGRGSGRWLRLLE